LRALPYGKEKALEKEGGRWYKSKCTRMKKKKRDLEEKGVSILTILGKKRGPSVTILGEGSPVRTEARGDSALLQCEKEGQQAVPDVVHGKVKATGEEKKVSACDLFRREQPSTAVQEEAKRWEKAFQFF